MKYTIGWIDATLMDNYSSESDLIKRFADQNIMLEEVDNDGQWYDFSAYHEFEAKDDQEAIKYCKNWIEEDGERIECFDLKRNNELIFTEEDLQADWMDSHGYINSQQQ